MILPHPDSIVSVPALDETNWGSRRAPLKTNAFLFMRTEYAKLGLAAAPIKIVTSKVVVRIVWVYPKHRTKKPVIFYLPFGSVSFPRLQDAKEKIGKGEFKVTGRSNICSQIIGYMNRSDFKDAIDLFSELGRKEIEVSLRSPFHGGHPKTLAYKARIKRVEELKDLWNQPRKIADILRKEGRYSSKVPIGQQEYQVRIMIEKIKDLRAKK